MITPRLAAVSFVAIFLAACGGSTSTAPVATPTATPTVAASTATLTLTGNAAQSLPAANGATASVSIAATGVPAGATVAATASTTPPSGFAAIAALRRNALAITRTALAYYTFVPSVDMQLASFPSFTIAFPPSILGAGITLHEGFLDGSTGQPVYSYDIATGASGATFTATATAPKLLAGKSYVFVFYIETGSNASPSPSPSATASAVPTSAPTTAANEIVVPAAVSAAPLGQSNVTDIAFFAGFAGTHTFGRGGLASFNGGTQALVTDCKLTVDAGTVKLEGGGATVTAPFISTNPNAQTLLFSLPDSLHIGVAVQMTFYDASGAGINVYTQAGRVTAASALKTGVALTCTTAFGTSITTDRSLDTLTFSASTIATLTARAGTTNPFTASGIVAADLGGASGTIVFGRGTLTSGGVTQLVNDCTLGLVGGTLTLSAGTFNQSASFTGATIDKLTIVSVQGSPTQFNFSPLNGKVLMQVNNFGFVTKAQATATDGSFLACPI